MTAAPRCRLAVAVSSPDEARRALEAGADYVLAPARRERSDFGVPERKRAEAPGLHLHFAVAADEALPAEPRRVAQISAPAELDAVSGSGISAILLAPDRALLRALSLEAVAGFVAACRAAGVEGWLGGMLELPDIPRLLVLRPDALVFEGLDAAGIAEARATIEPPPPAAGHGPLDRILLTNFVLPFEIGAYGFERGRAQRVRFNVEASVRRRPGAPARIADIYSYDLIMDAVRRLADRGHTDFVEALAEDLASELLGDQRLVSVIIRVEKLDLGPEAVGIEIVRVQDGGLID